MDRHKIGVKLVNGILIISTYSITMLIPVNTIVPLIRGMAFDGRGLIRGRGTEEWLFDGRGTTVGIYLFIVYVTGTCSHKDQNPFVQLH